MNQAPGAREGLALSGLLLIAVAIRILTASYGLWFDEIASLGFAREPLGHLWGEWMVRETNPPLYYTLLKGWIALAGDGDRAARLLSIAIGVTGIGFAWALARRLGGAAAGLLAAGLLALSWQHVDVSQQVRGYALAATAALAASWAMVRFLDARRKGDLTFYAMAATAALYAHTTQIVFVALANLAMIPLLRRDRAALGRWVVGNVAVALAWSWWAWMAWRQLHVPHPNFAWMARPGLAQAWDMVARVYGWPLLIGGGGAAALVVIGAILWLAWRDRRPGVTLLAVLGLGAPVLLFALSQAAPVLLPRTLTWVCGPAAVLLALAIVRVPARKVALAVGAIALILEAATLVRWLPHRQQESWREAVETVAADPRCPMLLVQGDAAALAAAHYRDRVAPGLPIMALASDPADFDRWADGMVAVPRIDSADARALLARPCALYSLRRGDSDPGPALVPAGVAAPVAVPGGGQPLVERWRRR